MAGINWESILEKAQACMNTPQKKRDIKAKIDMCMLGKILLSGGSGTQSIKSPKEAAEKFIEVLQLEIQMRKGGVYSSYEDGHLGPSPISELSDLEFGEPYPVGDKYCIDVYFKDNLERPSLAPTKYDGIDNIAALLNTGYTAGHRVYGLWESHAWSDDERIASLISRGGSHFIEDAVDNFMGNYSSEYGVEKIEISDVYK